MITRTSDELYECIENIYNDNYYILANFVEFFNYYKINTIIEITNISRATFYKAYIWTSKFLNMHSDKQYFLNIDLDMVLNIKDKCDIIKELYIKLVDARDQLKYNIRLANEFKELFVNEYNELNTMNYL
jgi:hypothetical protein